MKPITSPEAHSVPSSAPPRHSLHEWDEISRDLVNQVKDVAPAEINRVLLLHQRASWNASEGVPAEVYIGAIPCLPQAQEIAFGLVYSEFLLREELGDSPDLEEYGRRFPHLASELQRQVELHRALGIKLTSDSKRRSTPNDQGGGCSDSATWPDLPGYQILGEIGRGGMGIVYKASQCSLQRLVAVKVINDKYLTRPDLVVRFQREALTAAQLAHPNIVAVYDAGQAGGFHYYAMEYLEGEDLEVLVERSGPLQVQQACDFIRQVASGLQHAFERGLVHRDIKPANLMVTPSSVVKILDLGLARMQFCSVDEEDVRRLTSSGDMVGTPYYMAPEQILDSRNADIRADLYSLGCTFYYLLTGKTPFVARSVVEVLDMHRWLSPRPINKLRQDVPPGLSEIVLRLMAKRRDDRYQTPAELVVALEQLEQAKQATPIRVQVKSPPPTKPVKEAAGSYQGQLEVPDQSQMVRNLKGMLANLLEKNAFRPARPIVDALLRIDPKDSDALAALDFIRANRREREGGGERRVLQGHLQGVTDVAIFPDGKRAASGSIDKTWRLWDLKAGKALGCIQGHSGPVTSLAVSNDGRFVLSGSEDMTLRLWELNTDKALRDIVPANIIQQQGQMWEVNTARELRRFKGWQGGVNCLSFSADGRYALSGSKGGHVQLWNVNTGRLVRELKGHRGEIYQVRFSPEHGQAFSCSRDSTLRLWNIVDGRQIWSLSKFPSYILSAVFSPDGNKIAMGCSDYKVYIVDLQSRQDVGQLVGHQDRVTSVAITPDGQRLLSGSADQTLRLWDSKTGREITRLAGHTAEVTSVAISPDGRLAMSASKDSTVRLWELP